MVLMDGLEEGSSSVLARLQTGPFLAYRGSFPELEAFDPPEDLEGDFALGSLVAADLRADDLSTPVRALTVSHSEIMSIVEAPQPGEALISEALSKRLGLTRGSSLTLETALGTVEVFYVESLRAAVSLPETWVVISEEDLRDLNGGAAEYNLLLLQQRQDATRLEARGFTILSLSSASDFFRIGLGEARRVVLSIVVASSVAIATVAFSLLSLEVRYRSREIDTLRAVGLDRRGIMKLYGLQLAFILISGSVLGLAMGIVVANGLVSFSPFFGLVTIIRPQVTVTSLLLPLLSSLAAGLVGGVTTILLTLRRLFHGS
ncbi:MAG: ABC transporter permease [Thermoplasmata archaeon]